MVDSKENYKLIWELRVTMEIKTKQIIDPTCAFQCSSAWSIVPFGKQPLVGISEWLKILFPELCLSNQ